jgi:cytochrome c oxidase subunit 4
MTTAETEQSEQPEAEAQAEGHAEHPEYGPVEPYAHEHPSDAKYAFVALILAIITAAEVSTIYIEDPSTTFLVVTLIPMMIAKFAIVVGWFMHLRYDHPLFRRVFLAGLLLAVSVFLIALTSLHLFSSSSGGSSEAGQAEVVEVGR